MSGHNEWRLKACIWETTLACNARCLHCGSDAGEPRKGELSTKEGLRLVEELAELGCRGLTLSGGEPLLRGDWTLLASAANLAGMRVELLTNGLDVATNVSAIVDVGFAAVTFSIDGPAEVHDRLRGVQGGLVRLLRGADALLERGVSVGVVTQVNRLNVGALEETLALLARCDLEVWQVQLTMPQGRAVEDNAPGICLHPEQLVDLKELLLGLQAESTIPLIVADNIGYMSLNEPRLRSRTGTAGSVWTGCTAGLEVLGITSDGHVRGCLALPPEYNEGNVRLRDLSSIWNDPDAFAYSRQFSSDKLRGSCAGCSYGVICRGGCTGLSVATHGEPHHYPCCLWRLEGGDKTDLGAVPDDPEPSFG